MLIKIIHIQITREVLEIAGAAVRVGITTDEIGKKKRFTSNTNND